MSRRFQRALLLIVLSVLMMMAAVTPQTVQAAGIGSASCANPNISNITFGTVDLRTGNVNVSGIIKWSCTSSGILGILLSPQANITMCLNLDAGTGGTQLNPRLLTNGTSTLSYQLYSDAGLSQVWGSPSTAAPLPLMIQVAIPAGILFNTTVTGTAPFYAQLPGSQAAVAIGTFNSMLSATVNGSYTLNTGTPPSSCSAGPNTLNAGSASFTVTAVVQKGCLVTAGDINLGAVASTAVNTTANSNLSVTCTKTTPYYVGLSPSNGSTVGAGVMSGAISGNTDKVPYQLSSTPGPTGMVWGNTATSTNVGNGVGRTGTGAVQALTVYATAPSVNVTPDTYIDTVTVNVNY